MGVIFTFPIIYCQDHSLTRYCYIFTLIFLNVNYILSLQTDEKLSVEYCSGLFLQNVSLIFIFLDPPLLVGVPFQWPTDHLGSWSNIFNDTVHRPLMESHYPAVSMWHLALISGRYILTDILDL